MRLRNRQIQNNFSSDYLFFGWIAKRRRRKILSNRMPDSWLSIIEATVFEKKNLSPEHRKKLIDLTKVIVAEKNWEGCEGLNFTEKQKVSIASQASLLILETENYYFDGIKTVLLYPRSFKRKWRSGMIVDEDQHNSGEAWQGGPIVLSWKDVQQGLKHHDGNNVVVHEFAHHLDGIDGEMGGNPPFANREDQELWKQVSAREFENLVEAAEDEIPTLLDHYGATNRAEFFAVASETFIELPHELSHEHPDLFELLTKLYKFDPRLWQT